MPIFRRQLDGSPNAGDNCGPASVAMALRWATKHDIAPDPQAVRVRMHDMVGGTQMSEHRKAWDAYRNEYAREWDIPAMVYRPNGEFTDLLVLLEDGKAATIAIDYSAVPRNLKGDPLFNGLHSVFVAGIRTRAEIVEIKVFDPLNDGRRPGIPGPGPIWYPRVVLRKAASAVIENPGHAMFNVVRKGTPIEAVVPDPCQAMNELLAARVDLLEETLGLVRGSLIAHGDGIAAALADIDEVLDIPADTGQKVNG